MIIAIKYMIAITVRVLKVVFGWKLDAWMQNMQSYI